MNTGKLSHDLDYRARSVVPNDAEFLSYTVCKETQALIVLFKKNGEIYRTMIAHRQTYRRVYS